jgi:hypothetical protein
LNQFCASGSLQNVFQQPAKECLHGVDHECLIIVAQLLMCRNAQDLSDKPCGAGRIAAHVTLEGGLIIYQHWMLDPGLESPSRDMVGAVRRTVTSESYRHKKTSL